MTKMSLSYLIRESHEIAVEKGFWEADSCKSPIATKVALIHTEIAELGEAIEAVESEAVVAEELADIVIRTADLLGAMDLPVHRQINTDLGARAEAPSGVRGYAWLARLHAIAAAITQADRKDETIARQDSAVGLLLECFAYASYLGISDLWSHVLKKNEKNRRRPFRHGRRY